MSEHVWRQNEMLHADNRYFLPWENLENMILLTTDLTVPRRSCKAYQRTSSFVFVLFCFVSRFGKLFVCLFFGNINILKMKQQ